MEYMDGGSLQDVIDFAEGSGCHNEITLSVVAHDLFSALAFMHGNNLCHRDVKPANVLLRACDGRVKLGDFGIVKELSEADAHSSTFVGTMVYMSPERLLAKPYSFSSDIWSAGLSILALAMGDYPFPKEAAGSFWELLGHIKERADAGGSFMPPKDDSWKLSSKLYNFLSGTLSASPDERPSAAELLKHKFVTRNFRQYTEAFGSEGGVGLLNLGRRQCRTTTARDKRQIWPCVARCLDRHLRSLRASCRQRRKVALPGDCRAYQQRRP